MEETKPTPAPTQAAGAAVKPLWQKPLFLVGGAVAVIVVGIVGAVVLLNRSSNVIDATNPTQAAAAINNQLVSAIEKVDLQKLAAGNYTEALAPFVGMELASAQAVEFALEMAGEQNDMGFTAKVEGKTKVSNNKTSADMELTMAISPEAGADPVSLEVEIHIVDNELYAKIGELSEDLISALGGEMFAPFASIVENKWIKLDTSSLTTLSQATATDLGFAEADRQKLVADLKANPLLLDAQATSTRKVKDTTLSCMLAKMNPKALGAETPITDQDGKLEICTNGSNPLPFYVGINSDSAETGKVTVGVTVFNLSGDFTVEAPADAVTIEELFTQALGGGGALEDPSSTYDEEYQQYLDSLDQEYEDLSAQ